MILKLQDERKKFSQKAKAHRKAVRRYLRDISVCLPCRARKKHEILAELRLLIGSYSQMLVSQAALEEVFGTPEEIAQTYIGENAVFLLRRCAKKHRTCLFAILALLLVTLIITGVLYASPMVQYTETVTVSENETEFVYIPQPYTKSQLAQPRTGTKTVTCYDHHGSKLWSAKVTGTFGYIYGDTSRSLSVDCKLTTYENSEIVVHTKELLLDSAVVSTVTVEQNGTALQKRIILSCDRFGKLS